MTTPLPMNIQEQARIHATIAARASVIDPTATQPVVAAPVPVLIPRISETSDPRIAQLVFMFQQMDDRGQRTLLAMARTQVAQSMGGM